MGCCLDLQENRRRAIRAFYTSIRIDMMFIEPLEYSMNHSLLSLEDRNRWYNEVLVQIQTISCIHITNTIYNKNNEIHNFDWIVSYYR